MREPDRWGEAQQLLDAAGARTARVFEDVEAHSTNLAALAREGPWQRPARVCS